MNREHPNVPTNEQCTKGERLEDFNGAIAYACWYPQMGGYVGKCVITFHPGNESGTCFEAYVWHDGEFPFDDEAHYRGPVRYIHHCMPSQFINFGQFVQEKQEEHE